MLFGRQEYYLFFLNTMFSIFLVLIRYYAQHTILTRFFTEERTIEERICNAMNKRSLKTAKMAQQIISDHVVRFQFQLRSLTAPQKQRLPMHTLYKHMVYLYTN